MNILLKLSFSSIAGSGELRGKIILDEKYSLVIIYT